MIYYISWSVSNICNFLLVILAYFIVLNVKWDPTKKYQSTSYSNGSYFRFVYLFFYLEILLSVLFFFRASLRLLHSLDPKLFVKNSKFPLPVKIKDSFEYLKRIRKSYSTHSRWEKKNHEIETDATLDATLNQGDRPIAFWSRTLNTPERNHSPVEKEPNAIIEATIESWMESLPQR